MILRRRFGPKGDGVTREFRKLRNEDPYDLYYIRRICLLLGAGV
jgi:hypothetical protein